MNTAAEHGPATVAGSARHTVTALIKEEHRTLGIVLQLLQRLLHEASFFGAKRDFALLCAIVYYIDEFPERVHHPKEERHLFPALRRRTTRFDGVLEALGAEHVLSAQRVARIHRDLVHYQAGAPEGLVRLTAGVAAYAELLQGHMRTEERMLADACTDLTENDWVEIERGFGADRDPLAAGTRQEFRLLRMRIVGALPEKMRLDAESTEAMRRAERPNP
jgi:hemerythrin-like domain-containing protein